MRGVLLDPRTGRPESAEESERSEAILRDIGELARREAPGWKPRQARMRASCAPQAAGDQWYHDTKPPFASDDHPTITLAATSLMLWPAATYSPTYAKDWWPGKRMHIRCFGKITTAATPGNLTVELRYGTADNAGTILCTSAALTLIASQTNISWSAEFYIKCADVAPTAAGSLLATGTLEIGAAVVAAGQALLPASAPAATGSLDLNVTSGLNVQMKRSGSTAETVAVVDMLLTHLN